MSQKWCPFWYAKDFNSRDKIKAVKAVVEDAQFSLKETASRMSISEGSVHAILKDHLGYRKYCERWVPQLLTDDKKLQRYK